MCLTDLLRVHQTCKMRQRWVKYQDYISTQKWRMKSVYYLYTEL